MEMDGRREKSVVGRLLTLKSAAAAATASPSSALLLVVVVAMPVVAPVAACPWAWRRACRSWMSTSSVTASSYVGCV